MKLNVLRDGNAVGVIIHPDLQAYPSGFGKTLADALRELANELERYNCDLTPEQINQPDEKILQWIAKQAEAVYIEGVRKREQARP